MHSQTDAPPSTSAGTRRRGLLGLEPFFEGGWWHKGARARHWDVEDTLTALALFGDVTVDLSSTRSTPPAIEVHAWAIFRDVDVTVPPGTQVELTGAAIRGHLTNEAPAVSNSDHPSVVRVSGHTLVGDVTVRRATARA
jgi:hypothetical protein